MTLVESSLGTIGLFEDNLGILRPISTGFRQILGKARYRHRLKSYLMKMVP